MNPVAICYVGGEMMENKFMSLSPYQLAGCLRDKGIESEVIELTPANYRDDAIIEDLAEHDIVGFSCNSFTYPFSLAVLRSLKARSPRTKVVMGGIHVHQSSDYILANEPVDFIIKDEADRSFPQLVGDLRLGNNVSSIPGLSFRLSSGANHCNLSDKPTLGLDFPLPAYELLPKTPPILVFETSRGCPFRCTFCSIDQTSLWRGWEPKVVADRFETCVSRLRNGKIRNVMFGDDNFATNQARAAAILHELHQRFPNLILSFETRAREVLNNPLIIKTCAEEGIRTSFLFGIECGYDEGLKRIRKLLTVDEVRRSAKLLKDYGLEQGAVYSYIIGFPWETKTERMQTLRLAEEIYEVHGVKSTCFFWLPAPSPMTTEFNINLDFSVPYWWRAIQIEMNARISDEEADLMAKVNANGNFTDTRIDDTSRPNPSATGRSPRELPPREATY
jgi:radical SAM superfamily enzyme YgiQ (UPF0313 family)